MSLNTPVWQLIGLGDFPGLRYGIELEYEYGDEDRNIFDRKAPRYWSIHEDNSLRLGGIELVSVPLAEDEVDVALENVTKFIEQEPLEANLRCGTHVHLNVLPYTLGNLMSLNVGYTLLEPYLFKHFCPGREFNHFCVPSYSNTALQQAIQHDTIMLRANQQIMPQPRRRQPEVIRVPPFDGRLQLLGTSKYCAMSHYRLRDLGTVEMRQLRGTTNMKELKAWLKALGKLWHLAKEYEEPLELLRFYKKIQIRGLCDWVGVPYAEVDPLDVKESQQAAHIMVGHTPVPMEKLDWKMQVMRIAEMDEIPEEDLDEIYGEPEGGEL